MVSRMHIDEAEETSEYDDESDSGYSNDETDSSDDPDWDPIWDVPVDMQRHMLEWKAENLEHLQTLFALLMDTGEGLYGRHWLRNMSYDIFTAFCFKYTVQGANRN